MTMPEEAAMSVSGRIRGDGEVIDGRQAGQIEFSLRRLDDQLDGLARSLDQFHARLQPILGPDRGPEDGETLREVRLESSELAGRIADAAARVSAMRSLVETHAERIDL